MAYAFALVLAFGLPWSGALFRIGLVGMVACLFLSLSWIKYWRETVYSAPVAIAMALLTWIMVGAVYSIAPYELIAHDIRHYRKLLALIPFIMLCRTHERRIGVIYALLAGASVLLAPTVLDALGIHQLFGFALASIANEHYQALDSDKAKNLVYWRNHIVHGYFVCILLAACIAFSIHKNKYKFIYIFFALICTFDLFFLIRGRAALLCGFFIFPLLVLKTLKSTKAKVMTIIALALILYALTFIPHIHQRINSIATETESYTSTSQLVTSAGTRIHYWTLSKKMFMQHPILGEGLGSFRNTLVIQKDPLVSSNHFHAHNEFITLSSQNGIIGFLLLLLFLAYLVKMTLKSHSKELGLFGFLFLFVFCFNALTDSSLFNELEGWTFVMLAAVIASERCFPTLPRASTVCA